MQHLNILHSCRFVAQACILTLQHAQLAQATEVLRRSPGWQRAYGFAWLHTCLQKVLDGIDALNSQDPRKAKASADFASSCTVRKASTL
jgi:hypothetical protein